MWGQSYSFPGPQATYYQTFTYGSYNPAGHSAYATQGGLSSSPWAAQAPLDGTTRSLWGGASTATNYSDAPQELPSHTSFIHSFGSHGIHRSASDRKRTPRRQTSTVTPSYNTARNAFSTGSTSTGTYSQNNTPSTLPLLALRQSSPNLPFSNGSSYNLATHRSAGGGDSFYGRNGLQIQRTSSGYGVGSATGMGHVSSSYGQFDQVDTTEGRRRQSRVKHGGNGGTGSGSQVRKKSSGSLKSRDAGSGYSAVATTQSEESSQTADYMTPQSAYGSMYNFAESQQTPLARGSSFSSPNAQQSYANLSMSGFGNSSFSSSSFYGGNGQSLGSRYGSFRNADGQASAANTSAYNLGGFSSAVDFSGASAYTGDSAANNTEYTNGVGLLGDDGGFDIGETSTTPKESVDISSQSSATPMAMLGGPGSQMNPRMTNQNMYAGAQSGSMEMSTPMGNMGWPQVTYMHSGTSDAHKDDVVPQQRIQRRYSAPVTGAGAHMRNWQGNLVAPGHPDPTSYMGAGVPYQAHPARPPSRGQKPQHWTASQHPGFPMGEDMSPHTIGRNRGGCRRLTFSGEEVM